MLVVGNFGIHEIEVIADLLAHCVMQDGRGFHVVNRVSARGLHACLHEKVYQFTGHQIELRPRVRARMAREFLAAHCVIDERTIEAAAGAFYEPAAHGIRNEILERANERGLVQGPPVGSRRPGRGIDALRQTTPIARGHALGGSRRRELAVRRQGKQLDSSRTPAALRRHGE